MGIVLRACAVVLLPILLYASSVLAQVPPSCEEQLAETETTLMFVRVSRQTTEDTAGRVAARLQKRLDAALHEIESLKTPQGYKQPANSAQKDAVK